MSDLDHTLTIQLLVAWAGESGDPPRLGWWRTDMVSEYGGGDLFKRLLPNTWQWATLQAAREAARRADRQRRGEAHDADALVSLFGLGVETDRRLEERLADLIRTGRTPAEALPGLAEWVDQKFGREAFAAWLQKLAEPTTTTAPVGRRIQGNPPKELEALSSTLAAALLPLGDAYPLPHFKRAS